MSGIVVVEKARVVAPKLSRALSSSNLDENKKFYFLIFGL